MNSDLLIAVALFLLGRGGKKAAPAVTFVPAPGTSPAVVPAATPPKSTDVPWPKMAPTKPGEPLAFPAEIPWAPMPLPHSAEYAEYGPADPAHAPAARMRTGPARAERQDATHALMAREQQPFNRKYWRLKTRGLGPYVPTAQALLKVWKPGGYRFSGPRTWAGRVMYKMTQHGGKKAVEVWEPAPPFV